MKLLLCRLLRLVNKFSGESVEKRVKGIEPSSVAWKATALPLSYTRVAAKLARAFPAAKSFLGELPSARALLASRL